jgi:hypothetical protein
LGLLFGEAIALAKDFGIAARAFAFALAFGEALALGVRVFLVAFDLAFDLAVAPNALGTARTTSSSGKGLEG